MAESQLNIMEDGHMGVNVPESKPEFFYSEEQRAAIEQLLKNGDGAFKTQLKEDKIKDFLSAREVKHLLNTFKRYGAENKESSSKKPENDGNDSGVHSTYWPQMSDTEVPSLDIGWPSGGLFKGVTRVTVHTHPPKDNGPHIKEVVRKLIQGATKVIAIVMDLLTDIQILQDLMEATSRRSVAVYILLDTQGVPHFLDMCSRLQIGLQHLKHMRVRTLQGVGFGLSFGRFPGLMSNRYMLVDGDKVMFGSYSFSWCSSRMDRNMITVMTGQVVDFFDRDFRELHAISEKLDLFKEFQITPPSLPLSASVPSKADSKRTPLPTTTSRFQVNLGDLQKGDIQVPAHKYNNPKYLLALATAPPPPRSLQETRPRRAQAFVEVSAESDQARPRLASSERMDKVDSLPSQPPSENMDKPVNTGQKGKFIFRSTKNKQLTKTAFKRMKARPPTVETVDNIDVTVIRPVKRNLMSVIIGAPEQAHSTANDTESTRKNCDEKPSCSIS